MLVMEKNSTSDVDAQDQTNIVMSSSTDAEDRTNGNSDMNIDVAVKLENGTQGDTDQKKKKKKKPIKDDSDVESKEDKEESDKNENEDSDDNEEQEIKPLATTRSRRANAGNRMIDLIQEEEDDFYNNLYGGFHEEEDDRDFDSEDEDDDDVVGDEKAGGDSDTDSDSSDEDDDDSEDDDDDNDQNETEPEQAVKREPKRRKSQNKESKPKVQHISVPHGSLDSASLPQRSFKDLARICSVCLSAQSDEDDEIIECDSCGVTVHESCYGVAGEDTHNHDNVSVHSNLSSESTEPWFCEPCKRSVYEPRCELCPNSGGIFKETDTGRWVHMVCALYTRGVTFENIHNLTDVSLFELNYSLYGSKTCTICEDPRLARSGICIDCDAGLCKTFFHATCAQKEGLLFESHSDEVDPYFAQCKQHADKTIIKSKKRTCTALFARLKQAPKIGERSERIKRKLGDISKQPHPHFTKWTPENPPPIPQKSSRMLLTSPSVIIRLTKKSELMGLDPTSSFMLVQDEREIARQRWHIPPAFNLEFVAYCLDRATRLTSMKKKNSELLNQNATLTREESELREKFNSIKDVVSNVRSENEVMIREIRTIQKLVANETGKPFSLPLQLEQIIARSTNTKPKNPPKAPKYSAAPPSVTHQCNKCSTTKDQHLLSLCDTCRCYFHIYCLDPPLARVPKKTKFGGWQCSDCSEKDEQDQEEALQEQNTLAIQEAEGPRKLRERIKYPEKYCHESMLAANFWSASSRRKTKKAKSKSSRKKPKIEI